jgi:3-hydroxyisobutyrate dehydrogenase
MPDDRPTLGFIGLGIMGAPMARNLLKAGYTLHVYTRTRAKAQPVLAAGATWCDNPRRVAERCTVLLTIVTDTPDVQDVLFGPLGAAEGLEPGSIVVDMSTIRPDATRDFFDRLERQDVTLLDAPVTGGQVGAEQGALTILAGGPKEAFERVRPILEVMARRIFHVGPSGSGQVLKACNQILCGVNMIGVCEALMLARRSGLDLKQAVEALSEGAGGSWAWTNLGGKIVAGDLQPAFMIRLIQKDLRIVQDAAQQLRVSLPGTALAQQLFRAVEAEPGGADLGTQAMMRAIERLAGPPGT